MIGNIDHLSLQGLQRSVKSLLPILVDPVALAPVGFLQILLAEIGHQAKAQQQYHAHADHSLPFEAQKKRFHLP